MRLAQKCTHKALRIAVLLLIVLAMSLAVLLLLQKAFTPFQIVRGESMAPQIRSGDAVLLRRFETDDLEVGQVVVFRDPLADNQYIIHRVVRVEASDSSMLLTTKGDNNPVTDPVKVSTGAVVGTVAARLPHFGDFLGFLTSLPGYLLLIAIPAALAVLLGSLQIIAERPASGPAGNYNGRAASPSTVRPTFRISRPKDRARELFYPVPTSDVEPAAGFAVMRESLFPVPTATPE